MRNLHCDCQSYAPGVSTSLDAKRGIQPNCIKKHAINGSSPKLQTAPDPFLTKSYRRVHKQKLHEGKQCMYLWIRAASFTIHPHFFLFRVVGVVDHVKVVVSSSAKGDIFVAKIPPIPDEGLSKPEKGQPSQAKESKRGVF